MSAVLKWVGGKSTLMAEIGKVMPPGKRLIEPFAGSCAVTLNTSYERYVVADINQDLINLYRMIREQPESIISLSRNLFSCCNSHDEYYRLRDVFNQRTSDLLTQGALFLFLNRHGYRGLCRYNKRKGEFNVPYGHYKKPYFPEKEIHHLSEKLQNATLLCAGFKETLALAEPGDVVYCDPPYIKKSRFTQYHSSGFNMADQRELVVCLEGMYTKGVSVVASSHDEPYMRDMYSAFQQKKLIALRSVGVAAGDEKKADELLIYRHAKSTLLQIAV